MVRVADHLFASIPDEREVEKAWATEVERRIADVEAGRMPLVPAHEAIARARQALA